MHGIEDGHGSCPIVGASITTSDMESAPMPTTRTRRMLARGLAILSIATLALPAGAIVIRHDRDDARYLELGSRYTAAVKVLPDGAGVLIAPDWVLTAGHVVRGVSRRSPRIVINGREHEVARAFVHPDWLEMGPHDVGLFQLRQQVTDVTPVVLHAAGDEVGQVVTFVGTGDTGTGRTGPHAADGKKRGATNTVDAVDDDWIYFTFDEGDDATDLEGVSGPGDSGGPALVNVDGQLRTIGVSVFSDGKGRGPGRYGVGEVYARVSTHRDWIESVIAGKTSDVEVALGPGGSERVAISRTAAGSATLPASPMGVVVARYLDVYNSDSPVDMWAFIAADFDPEYRASKSEREHLEVYRSLFDEHFGALTVQQVIADDPDGLTVLFTTAKGPLAEFRFLAGPGDTPTIAGIRIAIVELD
jgi:hypothetical protein